MKYSSLIKVQSLVANEMFFLYIQFLIIHEQIVVYMYNIIIFLPRILRWDSLQKLPPQ